MEIVRRIMMRLCLSSVSILLINSSSLPLSLLLLHPLPNYLLRILFSSVVIIILLITEED
jgi:hypothetical protein